jgi:hypothetical protein
LKEGAHDPTMIAVSIERHHFLCRKSLTVDQLVDSYYERKTRRQETRKEGRRNGREKKIKTIAIENECLGTVDQLCSVSQERRYGRSCEVQSDMNQNTHLTYCDSSSSFPFKITAKKALYKGNLSKT